MNSKSGFTLVELMIVLAIVGIIAAIVCGNVANCSGATQGNATAAMRGYMTDIYRAPDARIQCVQRDSDGDGYVSCTGAYEDGEGKTQTVHVECAYWLNEGCRAPKMRAPQAGY